MYYVKSSSGTKQTIQLSDQLGKGGQATVYKLSSPSSYRDDCVKIYLDINKFERERIEFMIANPPQCSDVDSQQFRICWPKTVVYDGNNRAVGYIMPLAFAKSRDLKILDFYAAGKGIADHRSFQNDKGWHGKFERYDKQGLVNRMKMMHNWALAVYRIHSVGRYVLIDIKPENVLATSDGRISIVDTDSFQITDPSGRLLFNGPAFTEDYFPKTAYALKMQNRPFTIDCDLFALAVIFYKIFIGVHPYAGMIKLSPYTECNTIRESIENDLCVFGEKRKSFRLPPNSPHSNLLSLPKPIQQMFLRAFAIRPNLPTAKDWITTLKDEIIAISSGRADIAAAKKLPKATKPRVAPKSVVSSPTSRSTSTYTPPPTGRTAAHMSKHHTSTGYVMKRNKRNWWSNINNTVSDWGDDLYYEIDDYAERASEYARIAMWIIFAISVLVTLISDGIMSALIFAVILGAIIFIAGGVCRWAIEKAAFAVLTAARYVLYNVYTLAFTIIFIGCAFVPWESLSGNFTEKSADVKEEVTLDISSLPTTTYYCTAQSGLNIREGEETSSKIVGALNYGDEVELFKIEGDMAQIIFNGAICYVSKNYIKLKE